MNEIWLREKEMRSLVLFYFDSFAQTLFFRLFFLDLFLSEISATITAAAAWSWITLLRTTFMNSVWTTCIIVWTQLKFENRLWVTQVASYKSLNVRPA